MVKFINATPHMMVLLDKETGDTIKEFPKAVNSLRGDRVFDEDSPLDVVESVPLRKRPRYQTVDDDWEELKVTSGMEEGDIVIASIISCDLYAWHAKKDGVRMVSPACGNDDECKREDGKIIGSYFFYEHKD